MKTAMNALLIICYLNVNGQIKTDKLGTLITSSEGLKFYDFSKQSQIRIDSGLSEKLSTNQKIFTSNRCDIYVKSIIDSVEVCVYFYSKDTLIVNGKKIRFSNTFNTTNKETLK